MTRALTTPLRLTAIALGVAAATIGATARGAESVRTVYFAAVDGKGAAVTDLTAADLSVKEGGKDRAIAGVQPATAPMQVSILVDDGGTGAFQGAVAQFLETVQGHAQFAISALMPQASRIVDYTEDFAALKTALGQLGPHGHVQPDGEQIIDAVSGAAKDLQRRKAARPVIVALTANGETSPSNRADSALSDLKASGASLNVIYVTGLDLGRVLGDGPRQSGGFIDHVGGSAAAAEALGKIADKLMRQYVLTYNLPDGVKMSERLQLTTSRKGVTLVAPSRIPDK